MKVILMGNPNVGKSVIFSRLTGVDVISSNYPGTTVEYSEGRLKIAGGQAILIDAPGVYSLDPTSKAEEVTRRIVDEGADVIVNVVDATHLERNLNLTLQLLERGIPTVVALNLWDVATKQGIIIDVDALSRELGVPVIPTVAHSGQGILDLVMAIEAAEQPEYIEFTSSDQRWARIGEIAALTQRVTHRHPSLLENLEDLTIKPLTGIPVAIFVLYLSFSLVIRIGEFIIERVTDPLFAAYSNWAFDLVGRYTLGIAHDLLVGTSPGLLESFGLLTTGLYIPFGIVLPFLIPFYLLLGLLEDLGYLPRLSVLMDALFHRIGLHGASIMPCILGLGCSVPGVLAVRILDSPKQRYIAATLMTMAIPCASQNAMVFGILGPYGLRYIAIVYCTLFLVFIATGFILHRIIKEESPEIFMEIPPYRIPDRKSLLKKTFVRLRAFLNEAVPYIGVGMLAMNLFHMTGFMDYMGVALRPVISGMLGLPSDAAATLIIGFLRKDVGIAMFAPLEMTPMQLAIASVMLAMYFPCVATLMVLLKELGPYNTLKSILIRLIAALLVGTTMNLLLT